MGRSERNIEEGRETVVYQLIILKKALKDIIRLPTKVSKKISAAIDELVNNPRPDGSKKLKGEKEHLWRIRVGDYRIIYLVEDEVKIVEIRKVGHRKDIY
ncbi:MAG: type II toxin-antitoxin system RelE/ParE family toxin [Cyclobacteriaceae bacterium]